jgi:hypothetical protein
LFFSFRKVTQEIFSELDKIEAEVPNYVTQRQSKGELFPAPCRRGKSPPEAFFITMPASGVMCE